MRAFCLAAFAAERGAQVPFAFEEHATREGPSLYEYRPLVRGFVEEQSPTLRRLPDARNAIDDLKREPAAAIFARAHSGIGDTGGDALYRSILVPMLTWTAERCGGFDWNDEAFDAAASFGRECARQRQNRCLQRVRRPVCMSTGRLDVDTGRLAPERELGLPTSRRLHAMVEVVKGAKTAVLAVRLGVRRP